MEETADPDPAQGRGGARRTARPPDPALFGAWPGPGWQVRAGGAPILGVPMDTFFQSVAKAFTGNRQALPQVELAILLLLALVVLLQVGGLARRWLARRSRFHQLLHDQGVGAEDVRYAAALAARVSVEPLQLVTHLDLFERATAQALAAAAPGDEAPAARIRRLRHALGYDRLPAHAPLLSTRELAPGMALEVAAQAGTIVEVDEAGFTVEVRDPPDLPAGQQVALTLAHAREARYALGCRLAAAHPQADGAWHLRFGHDEHPARLQLREYVRVRLDAPIGLRPVAAWQALPAPAADVVGRLVDLSGGGAQLLARAPLPVGALVRAAFEGAGARFEGLRAVVLSCEPTDDGRRRLHLEFTGRPGAERERLVAALTQVELQAQAASRTSG